MLPPPASTGTAGYSYLPSTNASGGASGQNQNQSASPAVGNASTQSTPISGTGASANPPPTNPQLTAKFSPHDVQVLRQLLVAGEKHKWKQITKEINQTSNNNSHVSAAAAAAAGGQYGYQQGQGATPRSASIAGQQPAPKNISPTFVMKQYQSLLGLPNNALYFGSLGSSLPYVVAPNGWDDIGEQHYQHHFGDDIE